MKENTIKLIVTPRWPVKYIAIPQVLRPGVKFISFQTAITGPHSDGIPPLQARETLKLRVNYNCVRPAVWYAPLGYTAVSAMPVLPVRVLREEGGLAACVEVAVIREYPTMYLETTNQGKKFLTERQNEKRAGEYERTRERTIERVSADVEKQGRRKRKVTREEIRKLESGAELYAALHGDMTSVSDLLSESQMSALREYQDIAIKEMQDKISDEVKEKCPPRKISRLVKYRVACCHSSQQSSSGGTILTVWNQQTQLTPGRVYQLTNVLLGRHRTLATTRSTSYRETSTTTFPFPPPKPLLTPRTLVSSSCSEVDLIGRVLEVSPGRVVLGDTERAVECVVVGGDEVTVGVGVSVMVVNLQVFGKRYKINERTTVTTSPRDRKLKEQLEEFSKSLPTTSPSHWTTLLTNLTHPPVCSTTTGTSDDEMWDSIPDLPPLEAFQCSTADQTRNLPKPRPASSSTQRPNQSIKITTVGAGTEPKFSTDDHIAEMNCSARFMLTPGRRSRRSILTPSRSNSRVASPAPAVIEKPRPGTVSRRDGLPSQVGYEVTPFIAYLRELY
eukprot:sb/3479720/